MKELLKNKYSISKTIQFSLIPIGETEKNFNEKQFLNNDFQRADDYKKIKGYIDRYHKDFIESVLSQTVLNSDDLEKYFAVYNKLNKTEADKNDLSKIEDTLRKFVFKQFKSDNRYDTLFKKELITKLLPEFLEDEDELKITESFAKFTTYFDNFHTNRKNMYTQEAQSTGIAYRCINDNLPKFVDNIKSFEKVRKFLPESDLAAVNEDFDGIYGLKAENMFTLDYFSFVLAQSGIDNYNNLIGGYSNSDSSKVKGLNEYINNYNQHLPKEEKSNRLPLMKPLFKQILSDRESISFIPEAFNDDNEVLRAIYAFYNENGIKSATDELNSLFENIDSYDKNGIYISSGIPVTDLSNALFGSWDAIKSAWKKEYEKEHKIGKNIEKYYEKQNNEYKKIKSFSISALQTLGGQSADIYTYYKEKVNAAVSDIKSNYSNC